MIAISNYRPKADRTLTIKSRNSQKTIDFENAEPFSPAVPFRERVGTTKRLLTDTRLREACALRRYPRVDHFIPLSRERVELTTKFA